MDTISPSHNVGFSCKNDWRGPCPARGVTSDFVCWKRLLGATPTYGLDTPAKPSNLANSEFNNLYHKTWQLT